MTNWLRRTAAILLAALVALPALSLGLAAAGEVGFSVHAVIPDNQIDKDQTYFDLLMEPGRVQELRIQISNSSNAAITVEVATISASTNANGLIDYKTPDIRDETLKIPFSEIAHPLEETLTIPPGNSKTAVVRLEMPDEYYDGIVLGGIVVRRQNENGVDTSGGTSIQNVYSYVVGVQLRETDTEILADFEMVKVEPGLANHRTAIIHNIRNKEAAIAREVSLDIDIFRQGEAEPIASASAKDIRMAPNSVMPYAVMWPGQLSAGNYTSVIHMEQGDRSWDFEIHFTIGQNEAGDINAGAIDSGKTPMPWWVWLLILLLMILILLVLWLFFLLWKRRKDEEEKAAHSGGDLDVQA